MKGLKMDKRSILIILILILGVGCMYFIVTSSDTIGSAITDVNKSTITLPSDFTIKSTNSESALICNRHNNETIKVTDLGKQDSAQEEYNNMIKSLKKDSQIDDVSNTTTSTNDLTIYTINYNTVNGTKHMSYVYTYNHTYCIKMTGYTDDDKLNKDLEFVAKTIRPDYKKSQD